MAPPTSHKAGKRRRTVISNVIHLTLSLLILGPTLETAESFPVPSAQQLQWRIWTPLFGYRLPGEAETAHLCH